ncbi:30S ribosomal subunit protein S14 [Candidatus Hodgkinia cicadicola]|nr:30S ribosomal subunit protein S14 [Candidatus Hodgkinia cicadicola]
MSRLGALNNTNKIDEVHQKHKLIRSRLKRMTDNKRIPIQYRYHALVEMTKLPRLSSITRKKNRCFITGRTRGYYRRFGISRIMLRQLGNAGLLPGVVKSSW